MRTALHNLPDSLKHWLDAASITALLGNLISILPVGSVILTFVWMAIRVYETDTVQKLLNRKGPKP